MTPKGVIGLRVLHHPERAAPEWLLKSQPLDWLLNGYSNSHLLWTSKVRVLFLPSKSSLAKEWRGRAWESHLSYDTQWKMQQFFPSYSQRSGLCWFRRKGRSCHRNTIMIVMELGAETVTCSFWDLREGRKESRREEQRKEGREGGKGRNGGRIAQMEGEREEERRRGNQKEIALLLVGKIWWETEYPVSR